MITSQQLADLGVSPQDYEALSDQEKQVVNQVLKELATNKESTIYEDLYHADYDEIPVDFMTFISDDQYLGKSTRNGQFLYPFWKQEAVRIFSRTDINEVALSGCLSGDTIIPLINGDRVTIKSLAESGQKNFKVYSYDLETNRFVVGNAVKAFSTGYKMTYKVTFDNGETIRITGNHKFLTRDKHYKSINDGLTVGDSIMPFNYHIDDKGYEIISHPQKDGSFIEEPTHRMSMRSKLGDFKGTVHHKDYNKRNNLPSNLIVMSWGDHRHFHAIRGAERLKEFNKNWRSGNVSEDTKKRYLEGKVKGSQSRWSDPHQHEEAAKRLAERNKTSTYLRDYWNSERSNEDRSRRSKRQSEYNRTEHPQVKRLQSISKPTVIDALSKSYTIGQTANYLGVSCTGLWSLLSQYEIVPEVYLQKTPFNLPNRRWTSVLTTYNSLYIENGYLDDDLVRSKGYRGLPLISNTVNNYFCGDYESFFKIVKNFNHKIVSIYLNEIEEVYDIEVEKYHNFALESGVVVHNSIGVGKTTAAVLMMIYHLYKTMCMRDPQAFFNLSPGSEITYAFLNNTLSSSYGVAYKTFQAFIQESPWFLKHGTISGRTEPLYYPEKGFGFIVGSKPQHTLGRHIITALLDEVSFAPGQNVNYEKSKIMEVFTNIRRRMESRFMVQGKNYGMMFLVSSKATESSFLEAYIADQVKKGYPIYVVDQPLWKVKPAAYSGRMFKVAVGNKYLPSRIITGTSEENIKEQCESYKKQGLNIIDVPIEHKQAFDQNIEKALQDIAGISTSVVTKAFSMQKIQACISDTYENPFATEVVTLGTHDGLRLQDFFDTSKVPDVVKGSPIFIHLDASVSGDRTGLSGTAIIGTKQEITYGSNVEEESVSEELIMQQVFSVGIQAPSDSEISFEKTRQFIYYLHDEVGLNIKMVSTDGFQCLHKDSLIRTTKGLKPLQEILSDDTLYSYWGDVNKSVESTITKKRWTRFDTKSVLIKTSDGDLRTTLDHEILTNDSYIQAQDLSKYSLIRKAGGHLEKT